MFLVQRVPGQRPSPQGWAFRLYEILADELPQQRGLHVFSTDSEGAQFDEQGLDSKCSGTGRCLLVFCLCHALAPFLVRGSFY